ncbi:MAG: DUF779 domain-containing protein [Kineosporiaceae bacterium]|nr:DUF779 domain-containing protein [Kineosporiaceae bacterium]MBK8078329.1 DUF779 domain-containing protein [Kineosporiaceae bacterium]
MPDQTSESTEPRRVDLTDAAAALLRTLYADHGPLMFHQSGGCCDGSAPMCYPVGEFIVAEVDVHLGDLVVGEGVPDVPVYMSRGQFELWSHTGLTIDVVPGRGGGFSLEAPTGNRFLIRSHLLDGAQGPIRDGSPTAHDCAIPTDR